MKLQELKLRNFKGIPSFCLAAGCADVSIFGDNATGKTTLVDAVSWLLFDKDSREQKQFEIKPLVNGVPVTNTECEVEATFINGSPAKLKKVFKEKWTKPRGKAVAEFTGNTTDYYVDDVPVKAGEYKAKVEQLATREDVFKLLTSPTAFTSLHWQKQREMLLGVCGDISDADVIASSKDLAGLPKILDGKTCDERKAIIKATKAKINKDLESIPGRIDEAQRSKLVLAVTNPEAPIEKLTALRGNLASINDEIANLKSGGGAAKVIEEIATINSRLSAIRDQRESEQRKGAGALKQKVAECELAAGSVKGEIRSKLSLVDHKEKTVFDLSRQNEALGKQYDAIAASKAVDFHDCPTCGALPEDQPKRSDMAANFNQQRSERLASINTQGVTNKAKIEAAEKEVAELKLDIRAKEITLLNIENDIHDINQQIAKSCAPVPVEDNAEYQAVLKEKQAAEKRLADIRESSQSSIEKVRETKETIEQEIAENEKHLAAIEQNNRTNDRIAELKDQEKKLAKEFEKLEGQLFLIEQFIRAKVSMLEEKINDKFELVSFRLFKEQINEGLQEVCEVTVNGVPYNSLNSAGRIQAGLDIIKTLSNHHNFHPVIFVDNRESVTSLPDMDTQVISLIVSEPDKELRVVGQ